MNSTFPLSCQAMNYAWGQKGDASLVAQLLTDQKIDPQLPYAELWMGIHPNAPSRMAQGEGRLLSEVLAQDPGLLGESTHQRWGTLPFLFKVLSIAHPLSIQMHPHKAWAKELHAADPEHYPDGNHKPEIALAIDDVNTLVGLRQQPDVEQLLKTFPELGSTSTLKDLIPTLLKMPSAEGEQLLERIFQTLEGKVNPDVNERYFLKLYPQFSKDLGLLFVLFMPALSIPRGSALFLEANQLHAYLGGNLVECMANSDNVIRAGMTHKFKDVDRMLSQLSYDDPPATLNPGTSMGAYVQQYQTPAEEFELHSIDVPASKTMVQESLPVPSILLTLKGKGKLTGASNHGLSAGNILFIGANQAYSIEANSEMQAIRAIVPC